MKNWIITKLAVYVLATAGSLTVVESASAAPIDDPTTIVSVLSEMTTDSVILEARRAFERRDWTRARVLYSELEKRPGWGTSLEVFERAATAAVGAGEFDLARKYFDAAAAVSGYITAPLFRSLAAAYASATRLDEARLAALVDIERLLARVHDLEDVLAALRARASEDRAAEELIIAEQNLVIAEQAARIAALEETVRVLLVRDKSENQAAAPVTTNTTPEPQ